MSKDKSKTYRKPMRTLLAGGIAGCVAKTVVAPLDRVKILFQTSHPQFVEYQGSFKGFKRALFKLDMKGMFRGHGATLLRIFPYAGFKFATYEQLKGRWYAGSVSGVLAAALVYPLDLLRVSLAYHDVPLRVGLKALIKEGLFRGFTPTMIGMIPYAGVSFYSYEKLSALTSLYSKSSRSSPLICGAISGVIAQTVSYPFEVIRRHIQVKKGTHIISTARSILASKGWKGFYVGLGVGYIKVIPLHATSFFVYEECKKLLHV